MTRNHRVSLLLAGLAFGCGKSDAGNPTGPNKTLTLEVSPQAAAPFQTVAVIFPSKAGIAAGTVAGKLGSTSVSLTLKDSLHGAFLVPDLQPGTQRLTFVVGSATAVGSLTVLPPPAISKPRETTADAVASLESRVAVMMQDLQSGDLAQSGLTDADVQRVVISLASLRETMAKASEGDIRQFALFLATNPDLLAATRGSSSTRVPASQMEGDVGGMVASFSSLAAKTAQTTASCAAAAAAQAMGVDAKKMAQKACDAGLTDIKGRVRQQVSSEIARRPYVPTRYTTFGVRGAPRAAIDPNVPTIVSAQVEFRTFIASDGGIAPGLIGILEQVASAYNAVVSWLSGDSGDYYAPPQIFRTETSAIAGSEMQVVAQGCTVVPVEAGAELTCSNPTPNEISIPVSTTYTNPYGSVQSNTSVTVAGSNATLYVLSAFETSRTRTRTELSCYRNTVLGVSGNSSVTGISWTMFLRASDGNTYFTGGPLSGTIKPGGTSQYHQNVRFHWEIPVEAADKGYPLPDFTISYEWTYKVDATGQTKTASALWTCT